MYRVIHRFKDLLDDGYIYEAGDNYPRPGLDAPAARLTELATKTNRRGIPLIEQVGEEKKPTRKRVKKND